MGSSAFLLALFKVGQMVSYKTEEASLVASGECSNAAKVFCLDLYRDGHWHYRAKLRLLVNRSVVCRVKLCQFWVNGHSTCLRLVSNLNN